MRAQLMIDLAVWLPRKKRAKEKIDGFGLKEKTKYHQDFVDLETERSYVI